MIIASEIKQKLPLESSQLENRVRFFSEYHDSQVYVAQVEYQALMDVPMVEDGKPLDNGRARVFNCEFYLPPSRIKLNGHTWVFADEGPGRDAYTAVLRTVRILPYFREDIHSTYITLKQMAKIAADDLIVKIIKTFYGDEYRGIYLYASALSEQKPAYVPPFTFRQKSGHWDYAANFFAAKRLTPARVIDKPWAHERYIDELTSEEIKVSHKTTRFIKWAIGKQPPPEEVNLGAYDIAYVGFDNDESEAGIGMAPKLAKVGGLVVTHDDSLSDLLLHGNRNLRPFFTAEPYITLNQFLMKTK